MLLFNSQRGLINCVSGSLISQPNFSDKQDLTRRQITEHVHAVINYDPEFILKVRECDTKITPAVLTFTALLRYLIFDQVK